MVIKMISDDSEECLIGHTGRSVSPRTDLHLHHQKQMIFAILFAPIEKRLQQQEASCLYMEDGQAIDKARVFRIEIRCKSPAITRTQQHGIFKIFNNESIKKDY
jgi:hypothetical protein